MSTTTNIPGRGAAALAAIAIVAGACGSGAATSAPAGSAGASTDPGTSGEKPTLTFIAQIDNPSQAFSWKMYQKNAEKYGFDVAVCDNKGDVQQQTTCINDAVAQGTSAIAINPVDEAGSVPRRRRRSKPAFPSASAWCRPLTTPAMAPAAR